MQQQITIVGSGIAGCFLALLLAKRGYSVTLLEARSLKETADTASRRSFNITFYEYGVKVLKKIGIFTELSPYLLLMKGSVTYVPYAKEPIYGTFDAKIPYYTIGRAELLQVLLRHVRNHPGIHVHFQTQVLFVNRQKKTLVIERSRTGKRTTKRFTVLIGADGVHSTVRHYVQLGQQTLHSVRAADWKYKQIIIPAAAVERLQWESRSMYAWTGKDTVFTAFPQQNGAFMGMLILSDRSGGFSQFTTDADVTAFLTRYFPMLVPITREIRESLMKHPAGAFLTVTTSPWYYEDSIGIIGDAAHGFLPFSGQGISAAFADCLEIDRLLISHRGNWRNIFPEYQLNRKRNTDVLASLSEHSFRLFQRQKRADYRVLYEYCESVLSRLLPIFSPSLFILITKQPERAYQFSERLRRQRMFTDALGLPLLIGIVVIWVELRSLVRRIRSHATPLSPYHRKIVRMKHTFASE